MCAWVPADLRLGEVPELPQFAPVVVAQSPSPGQQRRSSTGPYHRRTRILPSVTTMKSFRS